MTFLSAHDLAPATPKELPPGFEPLANKAALLRTEMLDQSFKAYRQFDFFYHGLPVRIFAETKVFYQALKKDVPHAWQHCRKKPALTLYWRDARKRIAHDDFFEWDPDAEYHFGRLNDHEVIFQRDLIAYKESDNVWQVMTMPALMDGFMNVFRILLPMYLVRQKSLVFHSCAVLGRDGKVRVFIGDCGFGKSTTASLAEDRPVLGDDINILHFSEQDVRIQSAFLGGDARYKVPYDKEFAVDSFYWLNKAKENSVREHKPLERIRRLTRAPFFYTPKDQMQGLSQSVLEILHEVPREVRSYDLHFRKTPEFWQLLNC